MLVPHCRMRYSVAKERGRKEGRLSHQTSCKSVTGIDAWIGGWEQRFVDSSQRWRRGEVSRAAWSRGVANDQDQLNRARLCCNRVSPVTTHQSRVRAFLIVTLRDRRHKRHCGVRVSVANSRVNCRRSCRFRASSWPSAQPTSPEHDSPGLLRRPLFPADPPTWPRR
jgi:hypothetical protein